MIVVFSEGLRYSLSESFCISGEILDYIKENLPAESAEVLNQDTKGLNIHLNYIIMLSFDDD